MYVPNITNLDHQPLTAALKNVMEGSPAQVWSSRQHPLQQETVGYDPAELSIPCKRPKEAHCNGLGCNP